MRSKQEKRRDERGIPLFGRDEMNLVEVPFGPITDPGTKTMEIINTVIDRKTKRAVNRKLVITGSDAFGLPKPIDDQILIGLKTLSCEQGMDSPKVSFSRHELCRILGMNPDGRTYKRIEDSLDRIAGTTLKFKDSWWDKGEQEWRSHTFHPFGFVDREPENVTPIARNELERPLELRCPESCPDGCHPQSSSGKESQLELAARLRSGWLKLSPHIQQTLITLVASDLKPG